MFNMDWDQLVSVVDKELLFCLKKFERLFNEKRKNKYIYTQCNDTQYLKQKIAGDNNNNELDFNIVLTLFAEL